MPIEGQFHYEDGEIADIDTTQPGEIYYMADYLDGRISRVVGIECPSHDLCGVIHVVDDEDVLETFCETTAPQAFTPETQIDTIPPNGSCAIEIETRSGRAARVIMQHTVPFTRSLN